MSKPIKDYTLGEVLKICTDYGDCYGCLFEQGKGLCRLSTVPPEWDLTDHPRWNDGEVALAKALHLAGARTVTRYESPDSDLRVVGEHNTFGIARAWNLPYKMFPSLRINETVELEEIINAKAE